MSSTWPGHLKGWMRGKEKTQPRGLLQDVTEMKPDTRPYRGRMKERNEEGRRSEHRHGPKVLLKDRSRVSNDRSTTICCFYS